MGILTTRIVGEVVDVVASSATIHSCFSSYLVPLPISFFVQILSIRDNFKSESLPFCHVLLAF
jgi:hypothetical protein